MDEHTTSAQVRCEHGFVVLPATDPYERQLVREHLEQLTRRVPEVTLALDGGRWTVSRTHGPFGTCEKCAARAPAVRCVPADGRGVRCLDCVLWPECEEGRGDSPH
jgi:hypothetical protein